MVLSLNHRNLSLALINVRVSKAFYFSYWLKNTTMALATGLLMGLFASRVIVPYHPLFTVVAGALLAFVFYQIYVYNKFWGGNRGEFEFEFKLKMIDIKVKKLVWKYLGVFKYMSYLSDGMNSISTAQVSICTILLDIDRLSVNKENVYNIKMKLSLLSHKDDSLDKEMNYLISAIEIKPEDFLANCRLARCFEYKGDMEASLNHYQSALKDKSTNSEELQGLINKQIIRVQKDGLMKKPASMGLRYMSW